MRPNGSPKELERRRNRAISLVEEGYSFNEVARRIGCNASSVMRWWHAMERGGREALKPKPESGRPHKLKDKDKPRLVKYLLKGAMANGYSTDLWTTLRIAELIERKFGIKYHRDHVGRIMHDLGWSHQKPERRAIERNEEYIEEWKRTVWPGVKKRPLGWAPISFS